MTSFVSASKNRERREGKEERERQSRAAAGKTEERNHKAVDYKIISHGLTHSLLSPPTLCSVRCVFITPSVINYKSFQKFWRVKLF